MQRFLTFILILAWLTPSLCAQQIEDGVLDLREYDFKANDIITIDGDWDFYWRQYLTPKSDWSQVEKTGKMPIPKFWEGELNGVPLHGNSYATYRLQVRLPKKRPRLAFKFKEAATAYKVWINGKSFLTYGKPSPHPAKNKPGIGSRYITIPDSWKHLDIIINQSAYNHHQGGSWNPISFGLQSKVQAKEKLYIMMDMFLGSVLLTMGLYHLALWSLRPKNNGPALVLGAFFLLMTIRVITTNESQLILYFFSLDFYLMKFLEYVSIYLAVPAMMVFFYTLFPREYNLRISQGFVVVFGLLALGAIILPLRIYGQSLFLFQISTFGGLIYGLYGLGLATYRRRKGAALLGGAFAALALCTVHDIMMAMGYFESIFLAGFGIYILIFSQSFILAMMFSKAFRDIEIGRKKIEKLNTELEIHNQQLDQKVEEKTRDIRSILANIPQGICLVQDEDIRISHEYSKFMEEITSVSEISGEPFFDLIFKDSDISADDQSQMFTALLSGIGEDLFAFEVNAHLLIHEFSTTKNGQKQIFEIDWSPITNNEDIIDKYLVSIRNVTHIRKLLADADQRQEELKFISEIINVPQEKFETFVVSAQEFVGENEQLLQVSENQREESIRRLFRNMHTIKGNSRAYNLSEISRQAHVAESFYQQVREDLSLWDQERLNQELRMVAQTIEHYAHLNFDKLGRKRGRAEQITLNREELKQKIVKLRQLSGQFLPPEEQNLLLEVKSSLTRIIHNPLSEILENQFESLIKIATDLGKPEPHIHISDPGISFSMKAQTLVTKIFNHILRNSIDHGIESANQRTQSGKTEQGNIHIELAVEHQQLVIEYWDDGSGLDLGKIRSKSESLGILKQGAQVDYQTLAQMIFHPGFSTKDKVTDISGRGVGLDAIRSFIEQNNGMIELSIDESQVAEQSSVPFKLIMIFPNSYFDLHAQEAS